MDKFKPCERLSCEHIFEASCDEAANAFGFTPIVTNGVFAEIGLEMLVADGTVMRAEWPAFQSPAAQWQSRT